MEGRKEGRKERRKEGDRKPRGPPLQPRWGPSPPLPGFLVLNVKFERCPGGSKEGTRTQPASLDATTQTSLVAVMVFA
jgi:hypothetical protein